MFVLCTSYYKCYTQKASLHFCDKNLKNAKQGKRILKLNPYTVVQYPVSQIFLISLTKSLDFTKQKIFLFQSYFNNAESVTPNTFPHTTSF
jgi:hypothetical protein